MERTPVIRNLLAIRQLFAKTGHSRMLQAGCRLPRGTPAAMIQIKAGRRSHPMINKLSWIIWWRREMERRKTTNIFFEERNRAAATAIGALVGGLGLVVLFGWAMDIKFLTSLYPGWATMKANTAMGFVLAGATLTLPTVGRVAGIGQVASLACSLVVTLLGLLTLFEYALRIDLHIDQLLFVESAPAATAYPGRMALATALNFVMLGAALILDRSANRHVHVVTQILSVLVMLSSYIAIIGYAYNVSALYTVFPYSSVALHTAILFLMLGVGLTIKESTGGLTQFLTSPYSGGRAARRLLPYILFVPPTLGWLGLEGEHVGLFGTEFAMALVVVANIVIFAAVILSIVKSLDDADGIRQQETKFRGLLESAPDAMVIVDKEGRIALVNSETERLFGYQRLELIGQPVEQLLPTQYRTQHKKYVDDFVTAPNTRPMGFGRKLVGLRKDGTEFPVEVSLGPVQTGEEVFVSSSIRDITARRQIEAELEETHRKEQIASRAKSDFLSSMSHELRTPLNGILGFGQMLELDPTKTLTAKQHEYVGYILRSGNHLLNLVNEVLDLAGVEAGRLRLSIERVQVKDAVEHVQNVIIPLAKKAGVIFQQSIPGDVDDIRADRTRLHQVLLNLLSNAVKYNRPGGTVTLNVRPVPGGRIRFEVIDSGIGIAPERQQELFKPFQRLGAEYSGVEGHGIGLALSHKLVEAMAGTIGYIGHPGDGSTFWIELPAELARARRLDAAVAETDASRARAGGYSLLYVEDNPASLRLMEELVSTLPGVRMLLAPTARLGLDLAAADLPDVIVLDLNMPGMSGYEVLARLKAMPETRAIPVIALTAAAMPHDINAGLAAGFFRYITKPFDVTTFLCAVDEALAMAPTGDPAKRAG